MGCSWPVGVCVCACVFCMCVEIPCAAGSRCSSKSDAGCCDGTESDDLTANRTFVFTRLVDVNTANQSQQSCASWMPSASLRQKALAEMSPPASLLFKRPHVVQVDSALFASDRNLVSVRHERAS